MTSNGLGNSAVYIGSPQMGTAGGHMNIPPRPNSVPTPTATQLGAAIPGQVLPQQASQAVAADIQQNTGAGFKPTDSPTASLEGTVGYSQLKNIIDKADPSTVRQIVRDNWEKCLTGSEFHMAFLLNATIHQASKDTVDMLVRDFGLKMIQVSKKRLAEQLSTADLDECADILVGKAGAAFLDKALKKRFETIPAQRLLNFLAKAERLGYDAEDIVEEKPNAKGEQVIPSANKISMDIFNEPAPQFQPVMRPMPGPIPSNGSLFVKTCASCRRPCSSTSAWNYHLKTRACDARFYTPDLGHTICPHCGSKFGNKQGLDDHIKQHVCGNHSAEQFTSIMRMLAAAQGDQRTGQTEVPLPSHPAQQGTTTALGSASNHVGQGKHAGFSSQTYAPTPKTQSTVSAAMPLSMITTSSFNPLTHKYNVALPIGTPADNEDYQRMEPHLRASFLHELREAEKSYGELWTQALSLPEQRRLEEIMKIKNRWNTKQSNTRKKYGLSRLRGDGHGRGRPSLGSTSAKKQRVDTGGQRVSSAEASEPARQMVPLEKMGGGLTEASATAETTDPTQFLSPSKQRYQAPSSSVHMSTGQVNDPMTIDSDNSTEEDSSSDDDEDGIAA